MARREDRLQSLEQRLEQLENTPSKALTVSARPEVRTATYDASQNTATRPSWMSEWPAPMIQRGQGTAPATHQRPPARVLHLRPSDTFSSHEWSAEVMSQVQQDRAEDWVIQDNECVGPGSIMHQISTMSRPMPPQNQQSSPKSKLHDQTTQELQPQGPNGGSIMAHMRTMFDDAPLFEQTTPELQTQQPNGGSIMASMSAMFDEAMPSSTSPPHSQGPASALNGGPASVPNGHHTDATRWHATLDARREEDSREGGGLKATAPEPRDDDPFLSGLRSRLVSTHAQSIVHPSSMYACGLAHKYTHTMIAHACACTHVRTHTSCYTCRHRWMR